MKDEIIIRQILDAYNEIKGIPIHQHIVGRIADISIQAGKVTEEAVSIKYGTNDTVGLRIELVKCAAYCLRSWL